MIIKRIGVLSVAKIMGVLYGLIGLIAGCLFALAMILGAGATMMGAQSENSALGMGFGMGMGLACVVLFPIFYGVLGLIAGLISAALYNFAARFMGGIEIEVG